MIGTNDDATLGEHENMIMGFFVVWFGNCKDRIKDNTLEQACFAAYYAGAAFTLNQLPELAASLKPGAPSLSVVGKSTVNDEQKEPKP